MTEEGLKQFLLENEDDIKAAVKAKAIEHLLAQHRWDISDQIAKAVNAFVAEQIIPEVNKELQSQRGVLVNGTIKALAEISDTLAKSLAEKATETISQNWKRDQIVKAIFGL